MDAAHPGLNTGRVRVPGDQPCFWEPLQPGYYQKYFSQFGFSGTDFAKPGHFLDSLCEHHHAHSAPNAAISHPLACFRPLVHLSR